jgi:hypothetical protein
MIWETDPVGGQSVQSDKMNERLISQNDIYNVPFMMKCGPSYQLFKRKTNIGVCFMFRIFFEFPRAQTFGAEVRWIAFCFRSL